MSIILRKFRALLAPLAVLAVIALAPISASAQFADQATYVAVPGGTANAITLAVDNWNINRPGVVLRFIPAAQNTGATTVLVNGVGSPIALRKQTGSGLKALTGGELVTTQIASISYDGSVWELLSPQPQVAGAGGYLTPCQVSSPSPVAGCSVGLYFPTGSVTSATTLYYEPVADSSAPGTVPISNGGKFITTPVTESQMTLILSATANTANNIYDVCIYDNGGTPAIGTMPAWSNAGLGAGTRGTAAAITTINGIWVNNISATVTNNNIGTTVGANLCTIVATIGIDGVNGQVSFLPSYGQSRKWGAWNFYNSRPIILKAGDSSAQWTMTPVALRPANNNSANSGTVLIGLQNVAVTATYMARTYTSGNNGAGSSGSYIAAIGYNSTAAISGTQGYSVGGFVNTNYQVGGTLTARYLLYPVVGINRFYALEGNLGSGTALSGGAGETNNLLTIEYRG